jgi:hypothetical protein
MISTEPQLELSHFTFMWDGRLSDGHQLALAQRLAEHPAKDPWKIAEVLEDKATTSALTRPLLDALQWMIGKEHENVRGRTLVALSRVAPSLARAPALQYLKTVEGGDSSLQQLYKTYAHDPEVHALAMHLVETHDYTSAMDALAEAGTTECIPLLLTRMKRRPLNPMAGEESRVLEKITGHLFTPGKHDESRADSRRRLEEWESWWNTAQTWTYAERRKSNLEQGTKLLEQNSPAAGEAQGNPVAWQHYHMHLTEIAGADPTNLTTETLRQSWNNSAQNTQNYNSALDSWKRYLRQAK